MIKYEHNNYLKIMSVHINMLSALQHAKSRSDLACVDRPAMSVDSGTPNRIYSP